MLVVLLLMFTGMPITKAETEYPPYQDPVPFSDLKGLSGDIMFLYKKNIIGGYPDGTFKPNEPITRGQVAAMLVKAFNITLNDNPTVEFKDLSNASNYYLIMATINEKGFIRGENGYIRPGEKTTRAQMAAILRRALDLPLDDQPTFVDVSPAHWAYGDINSLAKNLIGGGYQDGTFKPGNPVTRSQFSSFLARAIDDKMKLAGYHSAVSQKGVEIQRAGWLYTIKNNQLVKNNLSTKEEIVLLSQDDFKGIGGSTMHRLRDGFPIILYNNEIYISYWNDSGIKNGLPTMYGLMATPITGGEYRNIGQKYRDIKMYGIQSNSIRNVTIQNFSIYFTVEKKERHFDKSFDENVKIDDTLVLYSADQNGSGVKKVYEFEARVAFDEIKGSNMKPAISQNNKSVKYDPMNMYYFNNKGVFKYSLLNGKTTRMSTIQAKEMTVTDTTVEIVDTKGKKYMLKK